METGKFIILQLVDDGPSRIEGKKSYSNIEAAENSIKDLLAERYPHATFMIAEIHHHYWRDQVVRVKSTKPSI